MNFFQISTIILSLIIICLALLIVFIRKNLLGRIQAIEKNSDVFSIKIDQLEEVNKKQQDLFDLIIDSIPHGIVLLDDKLKIKKINESISSLFYLDKIKTIGSTTINIFNNKNLEDLITEATSTLGHCQKKIVFYQDEEITLNVDAIPVKLDNYSVFLLLKNTTQEAEFSKLRSQFVSNISHEMRTPLTSIKGYVETLLESNAEDKELNKKYLLKADEEVDRLSFLIKDVLDLSSIEYRRNILLKQEFNLIDIIRDCMESLRFLAEKNSVKIIFNPIDNIVNMQTDEELFRQLVMNIIENAIFHGGKSTRLNIELQNKESEIMLVFYDNGVGIEKSDQQFIFQRFYRGKNPVSSKKIGSGLGLAIVKHIVELHDGTISLTSTPGIETRFTISFPK
jgi:two-component system, OmpR family, phosphate regulon sensor histidine kinase PhoR